MGTFMRNPSASVVQVNPDINVREECRLITFRGIGMRPGLQAELCIRHATDSQRDRIAYSHCVLGETYETIAALLNVKPRWVQDQCGAFLKEQLKLHSQGTHPNIALGINPLLRQPTFDPSKVYGFTDVHESQILELLKVVPLFAIDPKLHEMTTRLYANKQLVSAVGRHYKLSTTSIRKKTKRYIRSMLHWVSAMLTDQRECAIMTAAGEDMVMTEPVKDYLADCCKVILHSRFTELPPNLTKAVSLR